MNEKEVNRIIKEYLKAYKKQYNKQEMETHLLSKYLQNVSIRESYQFQENGWNIDYKNRIIKKDQKEVYKILIEYGNAKRRITKINFEAI